tara:strand:- start:34 stop:495 length:462 start_codon:yes stop_codon:yes gene_type:complete
MNKFALCLLLVSCLVQTIPTAAQQEEIVQAQEALEEYFRAWNDADNEAIVEISNFPRLSLGRNGQVVVRQGPEDITTDFNLLRQAEGWDHSTLDLVEVLQVSQDTVHFKVLFSRRHQDGVAYRTVPGLFIMTKQDGHWGLQLQSMLPATFEAR